jgi:pilus assembly protein CpaB
MANYMFEAGGATPTRGNPRGASSARARSRALIALVVAVGAGLCAAVLVVRLVARRSASGVVQKVPLRKVAIAKQELPMATTVTAEMVTFLEWPVAAAPEGGFDDTQPVVGRVVRSAMMPGEPFLEGRLAPRGAGDGLSAVIPSEMRAMTVRVNESSGVAGFVHPGDRVDVVATMQPREGDNTLRSRVVLQNIAVVAVGAELTAQSAKPIQVPVVTLLVTPEQSERLALSASHGELQLTLRAGGDPKEVETPGVSPFDLYGVYGAPQRVPASAPVASIPRLRHDDVGVKHVEEPAPEPVIEIIRGSRSEERRVRTAKTSEGR